LGDTHSWLFDFFVTHISDELATQEEHVRQVQAWLNAEKPNFVLPDVQQSDLITQYLQVVMGSSRLCLRLNFLFKGVCLSALLSVGERCHLLRSVCLLAAPTQDGKLVDAAV
jgi:hypothetical protein